ncbi:hypothetical protein SAY86_027838 [Trapa natans]|uniref:Uncharacterized protein n=1 Tax=Trapa natans TaxID=22666 RepID=A0AAN7RA64_TRANT|nr:hypothetical protein SAY86_027838 [Trapa natans]
MAEERFNVSDQLAKLKYQLEYEKKCDMDSRIKELESSISTMENNLKNKKAAEEIGKLKEEIKEWKVKSDECEKEMQEWKKQASGAITNISKLSRQINIKVVWDFLVLQIRWTLIRSSQAPPLILMT